MENKSRESILMVTAISVASFLNELLKVDSISDDACNGLQVENSGKEITRIGFAVDACMDSYRLAWERGCQMLVVHHGLIWKGLTSITANVYKHIRFLFDHDLALYGVHLPLDMHPVYGNNAVLAKLLNLKDVQEFGMYHGQLIGCVGTTETTLSDVQNCLQRHGMRTQALAFGPEIIRKIAIISGAAAGEVIQAIKIKADLYITGEPTHHVQHLAKESRIHVLFGGHYETEVWGLQALMPVVQQNFDIETCWIETGTIL